MYWARSALPHGTSGVVPAERHVRSRPNAAARGSVSADFGPVQQRWSGRCDACGTGACAKDVCGKEASAWVHLSSRSLLAAARTGRERSGPCRCEQARARSTGTVHQRNDFRLTGTGTVAPGYCSGKPRGQGLFALRQHPFARHRKGRFKTPSPPPRSSPAATRHQTCGALGDFHIDAVTGGGYRPSVYWEWFSCPGRRTGGGRTRRSARAPSRPAAAGGATSGRSYRADASHRADDKERTRWISIR